MSFVAEGVRSVRVASGALRLPMSSWVFFEFGFFMIWFSCIDYSQAKVKMFQLRLLQLKPKDILSLSFREIIGRKFTCCLVENGLVGFEYPEL
jgi:hypothetical protein